MAHPHARPRYSSYGAPLPELTDARREDLRQRPTNMERRSFLIEQLEQTLGAVLKRGFYAEVTLRFRVHDGMLMDTVHVQVRERRQVPKDE